MCQSLSAKLNLSRNLLGDDLMGISIPKTRSIITVPKCKLTRMGLQIADNTTFAEWVRIGSVLKTIEGSVNFWIGDWIRFGEQKKWGEKYAEAVKETGLALCNLKMSERF